MGKDNSNTIKSIDIYVCSCKETFSKDNFTNEQLNIVKSQLEKDRPVDIKSEYKTVYISEYSGYQVTYVKDYEKRMSKQNEKEINLE